MVRVLMIAMFLLAGCQFAGAPRATERPVWQRESVTRRIREPNSSAAALVPADARWYVRLDKLGDWLDERDDPLIEHLWKVARAYQPAKLWKDGAERMGLSDENLVRAFFGRTLVLVDQKIDDVHGVVMMTRVDGPLLEAFPGAMGLSPHGEHERIGPFATYIGHEGEKEYLFAVGRRWLLATESKYAAHLRRLLTAVAAGELPLSRYGKFGDLLSTLPRQRDGVMLVLSLIHI